MKKLAVVSFTKTGTSINHNIVNTLIDQGYKCFPYACDKFACDTEVNTMTKDTREWIYEYWYLVDAFLFIGSVETTCRLIAKNCGDKLKDPAILVMDEAQQFVVPIMGNHLSGGDDLAMELESILACKAIVTTPLEVRNKFSLEHFAEINEMEIDNKDQIRAVSIAILEGQEVGLFSEYPIEGQVPEGVKICKDDRELSWYKQRLTIRKEYVVGMGLKEGVPFENVEVLFLNQLKVAEVEITQVKSIATMNAAAEEPALLTLAEKYGLPIVTFTAKELKETHNNSHIESVIKNEPTISECSAVLGCEDGTLVQRKATGRGVTFALARKNKTIYFS